MHALLHRVKVFVFTQTAGEIHYLVLRHAPRHDAFWGPVEGPILPSENLELAACRRVRDEIGIERPRTLLDLRMPERSDLPDESVVEWAYGYGLDGGVELKRVSRDVCEYRWDGFDSAFRAMELRMNQEAILRLHLMLTR